MRLTLFLLGMGGMACTEGDDTPSPVPDSSQVHSEASVPLQSGERERVLHTRLILITLDTTRADRLGSYGHEAAATPNLDALAARGTRFTKAFSPTPLTIPSHSTLFTGLLPPHHGVRDNGDIRLSDEAWTLAEALQESGYRTDATVAAFVTQNHWGFGQGFDQYRDDLGVPADRLSWRAERTADGVIDDALLALDEGADFLWVHLFDAHHPYEAPEPFATQQSDPYDAELAWIDHQLARLLERLSPEDLVVVVGDHGEGLGDDGEREHGLLLGDATTRVPLIIAGPGVPPAVETRAVGLADVAPTLVRLLDVPWDGPWDGVDLFEPTPRHGVYSETLYGHHHYGWSPLYRITTDNGTLTRGARDEQIGEVTEEEMAWFDEVPGWVPVWEAQPATLDPAQIEMLQALGYVGGGAVVDADGMDPRDGVGRLRELHQALGEKSGDPESGLRALLEEFPSMRDARFRLARLLVRKGQMDEAISVMTTSWQLLPDSTSAGFLGHLWLQYGHPGEALSWFREAQSHDPRALDSIAGEVEALIQLNQLQEAEAVAELALETAPDHGRLLQTRALLALRAGEPSDPWSEVVLERARSRPYERGVLQVAAALFQAQGESQQAEEYLKTELRWRPSNVMARLELRLLYREQGRWVDAVKVLIPLHNLDPGNPRWSALTAQDYLAMDRPDLAEPFRQACKGREECP